MYRRTGRAGLLSLHHLMLLGALLLTGCGEIPLRDPEQALTADLRPRLEQAASAVQPGQSDRATVRGALGQPWLSSDTLGVDAFRYDAKTYAPSLLVVAAPFPIPLPMPKWESGSGFLLVTYDADGVVDGVAYGIDEAESTDSSGTLPARQLTDVARSGGVAVAYLSMSVATKGLPVVTIDPERRRRLSATPDALSCRLLTGCFECDPLLLFVPVGLSLDGQPLPTGLQQGAPMQLAPGSHEFLLPAKGRDQEARATFDCAAGQLVYATFLPDTTQRPWHLISTRWTISVVTALDARHEAAPLVFDDSGMWPYWMLRLSRTNLSPPP